MQFEGMVDIQAPREKVWEFLTSPDLVSQCAPGVRSVEVVIPDKQFKAVATIGFGSAKATFQADIEWMEVYPHRFARMKAHGITPGSGVDVISEMRLTTHDKVTILSWTADIVVVGSLASTAARLMDGITRNLTTAFFDCVRGKIEDVSQPDSIPAAQSIEDATNQPIDFTPGMAVIPQTGELDGMAGEQPEDPRTNQQNEGASASEGKGGGSA